jgi:TonB-dependent starch-binding outer membrane protein SusC
MSTSRLADKSDCIALHRSASPLKSLFLFFLLSATCSLTLFGQSISVKGTIVGDNETPLQGVSVTEKGTKNGTTTNASGNFSITVASSASVLVFSYSGYLPQEQAAGSGDNVQIKLIPDEKKQALDEVVVIGYGTQKKKDLTGAVGSISRKDFANKPFTSPDQILTGRIAGVNITNRSGDPGAPIEVRIRGIGTAGNNQPLWIIDGVPVATNTSTITVNTSSATESNPLSGINPSDIESIDVLKDASATAIYGARANNGVILVTTKRGKAGVATLSYDGYVGIQAIQKSKLFDVLNVAEYIKYQKDEFNNDYSQFSSQPNVDWQDLVFKKGFATTHNLTLSGGNQNSTYSFGGGYFKQEGVQLAQNFTRYSAKATADTRVGKYMKFGESFLLSRTERQAQSEETANSGAGATRNAPFFQPYTSTGEYNPSNNATTGGAPGQNLLWQNDPSAGYTKMMFNKILGSLYGELEPIKGLKYKATLGIDYSETTGLFYQAPVAFDGINPRLAILVNEQPKEAMLTLGHTLTYDKSFGKNKITALVGYEQTSYLLRRLRVQGNGLFNPPLGIAGGSDAFGTSETADHWNIQGKIARLFYSYDDKYLVTATVRQDKSSRFAKQNNTGTFPSFALGWRLSEERFLKDSKLFNDLKLRVGWGQSGNQFTGTNFSYLPALSSFVKYIVGKGSQTIATGYAPVLFANPDLKWETAIQTNIGLDFSMLNYKLSGSIDYFSRTTKDLLMSVPVALTTGFFQFADLNSGTLTNKGIEFTANYRNKIGDVSYNIGGNFTYVKNEFTKLPDGIDYIQLNDKRISVGQALGYFYGYKTDGIYHSDAEVPTTEGYIGAKAGDIKFVDVNGDKKLTSDDRGFIGSPIPKFYYGINLGANYKAFDLSLVLQGVGKYTVYDGPRADLESMNGNNNQSVTVLDRWTTSNTGSNMPRANSSYNNNIGFSDRFLENAAFMRVKNLQIGYNLKSISATTNGIISYARFYIGVSNLFTFTKYKGFDPEVTRQQSFAGGENQFLNGYDNGNAPQPRMFQFGWQINF